MDFKYDFLWHGFFVCHKCGLVLEVHGLTADQQTLEHPKNDCERSGKKFKLPTINLDEINAMDT